MYKKLSLVVLILVVLTSSACSAVVLNSPTTIPPTPTPKNCFGVTIHLLSVKKTVRDDGWTNIEGSVAFENTLSDNTELLRHLNQNINNPNDDFSKRWAEGMRTVTAEGFKYELHVTPPVFSTPKGLRYRPQYGSNPTASADLNTTVSSASTHWTAITPCGDLDIENPEPGFQFPVALPKSYYAVGKPVDIGNGSLTITSVENGKPSDFTGLPQLKVSWKLQNDSKGYELDKRYAPVSVFGDNGLLVGSSENMSGYVDIKAGPGQVTTGSFEVPTSSWHNVMLVMEEYGTGGFLSFWLGDINN